MNAAKIPLLVRLGEHASARLDYRLDRRRTRTTTLASLVLIGTVAAFSTLVTEGALAAPNTTEFSLPRDGEGDVEIVIGEDKTIYEYRANGVLMIIKVVPKKGRPYYMVPADGSPHYTDLDHSNNLYPQWILLQW